MACKYCGGITRLFWIHKNRAAVIRAKTYRCESCAKTQKVHTDRFGRTLSTTAQGFREAWGEAMRGETYDISTLFDDWDEEQEGSD